MISTRKCYIQGGKARCEVSDKQDRVGASFVLRLKAPDGMQAALLDRKEALGLLPSSIHNPVGQQLRRLCNLLPGTLEGRRPG